MRGIPATFPWPTKSLNLSPRCSPSSPSHSLVTTILCKIMGSKGKNKNNKIKPNHENPNVTDKIIADPRFASVYSDPRFQRVPKNKSKVRIDSRLSLHLSNKFFAPSSAPVDKRGKPRKKTKVNSLSRYYQFQREEGEERDSESEEKERSGGDDVAKRVVDESEEEEVEEEKEDEESEGLEERYASESSTDSDDDEEEDEDIYDEEEKFVPEENIPIIERETDRLAVVDMDWRHVKAVDLYVLLSSFLPKDGQILSVAVYPSEFGLQRMKEEEVHGPVGLFDDKKDGDENDDYIEIDDEELRAYEKSRLRYYFAVVECNSVATAGCLYNACDGADFGHSANVLDLRFIPDSMEFKHPPRDVATEAPANYAGLDFETRALRHSKPQLTWDEDEPERVKTMRRKFNADQLADLDLKEFLASDESESDDDDGDDNKNETEDLPDKKQTKRDAYRALLEGGGDSDGGEEDEKKDMEVTFITGLEDLNKRILEKKDQKSETVWEASLRKRREKKKARTSKHKKTSDDESSDDTDQGVEEPGDFFLEEGPPVKRSKKDTHGKTKKLEKDRQGKNGEEEASRAVLELLLADENEADNSLKGYNLKRKKAKGNKGEEAMDEDKIPSIDYDDPRLSVLFSSPDFALDPTDPQFKRSAVYARQLAVKQQKGDGPDLSEKSKKLPADVQPLNDNIETPNAGLVKSDVLSSNKEKFELSSLVRSVKMKSKQLQMASSSSDVKEKKRKRA